MSANGDSALNDTVAQTMRWPCDATLHQQNAGLRSNLIECDGDLFK